MNIKGNSHKSRTAPNKQLGTGRPHIWQLGQPPFFTLPAWKRTKPCDNKKYSVPLLFEGVASLLFSWPPEWKLKESVAMCVKVSRESVAICVKGTRGSGAADANVLAGVPSRIPPNEHSR